MRRATIGLLGLTLTAALAAGSGGIAVAGPPSAGSPAPGVGQQEAAANAAKSIDAQDPDRVRSTVAVATRFFEFDRNRAWEIMADAVKAANAAPEYTGADSGLSARIQTRNQRSTINFPAPVFDLTGVFQTLARDDMNRAVALAQTFTGESPRAVATLAIARAVLGTGQTATANR